MTKYKCAGCELELHSFAKVDKPCPRCKGKLVEVNMDNDQHPEKNQSHPVNSVNLPFNLMGFGRASSED